MENQKPSTKEEMTQIFNLLANLLEKAQKNGSFTLQEATQIVQALSKLANFIETHKTEK